jgi:hypothetical protein
MRRTVVLKTKSRHAITTMEWFISAYSRLETSIHIVAMNISTEKPAVNLNIRVFSRGLPKRDM